MKLSLRFSDPETERAYLLAERAARGQPIRALIVIAVVTLLSYIVINPLHFPPEGVMAYTLAAGFLIAVLSAFFALTRTRFYLDQPWIDLPIFVAVAAGMKALALALADLSEFTGFAPHVMAMVQMAILVVFASVGFVGTFRLFLVWAFAILGLFVAWLMTLSGVSQISQVYTLTNFSTFFLFSLYFNWDIDRRARKVFAANAALDAERRKTEELLYNVLPQPVAARLKAGEAVADSFSDLTVIFVDIVGFSRLAKRLAPGRLVKLLNLFFSTADRCAERHGIEKVKTIGDAYLAVAGGMGSADGDSRSALAFARDLIAEVARMQRDGGIAIDVRIGVHTGPVIGGVIGSSRLAYDYWGDTMNIASRLQGEAPPGGVAVSEATWHEVRGLYDFEPRRAVLKGIGETDVYVAASANEAPSATAAR